jgi:predicted dehydrogenase
MNRRDFFNKTFAAGVAVMGFPTIIRKGLYAQNSAVAPSNRITMGFIGAGGIGQADLTGFLEKPHVQVLAICDVDEQHRNQARDMVNVKYGNKDCATYNDFRELLQRQDIDAVCIAVPDQWHAVIAIAAVRAGKDIYGEKPLAYTIAEGRAIVDAVKKHRVIWQTGSQQRSSRDFRFACELVRNGRIGHVHTIQIGLPYGNSIQKGSRQISPAPKGFDYDMWLGPAPYAPYCEARCHWNFRWISDYSGGQITDWAGHHCDIAQWAMDTEDTSPVEIEGKGVFPNPQDGLFDTCESYRFECKYSEGFRMIVMDDRQHPWGNGVLFSGTTGWIFVSRSTLETYPESLTRSVIGPNEIHLYKSEDHRQNFIDCVKSRQETIAPAHVAHRSIMIGHLGLISIKLGRKVYWNPSQERFVNDPEADRFLSRPMRSPWHV